MYLLIAPLPGTFRWSTLTANNSICIITQTGTHGESVDDLSGCNCSAWSHCPGRIIAASSHNFQHFRLPLKVFLCFFYRLECLCWDAYTGRLCLKWDHREKRSGGDHILEYMHNCESISTLMRFVILSDFERKQWDWPRAHQPIPISFSGARTMPCARLTHKMASGFNSRLSIDGICCIPLSVFIPTWKTFNSARQAIECPCYKSSLRHSVVAVFLAHALVQFNSCYLHRRYNFLILVSRRATIILYHGQSATESLGEVGGYKRLIDFNVCHLIEAV